VSTRRLTLRIAGIVIILAVVAYWFAAGANRGWTKNRVAVMKTDEITGIEYPEYEDRFVPGIEFLAAGCVFGALLTGATFFFRKKSKHT
jgi:hypothetical protein